MARLRTVEAGTKAEGANVTAGFEAEEGWLEISDVMKKKSEGEERVLAIRASIFVFISKSGMVCIFVVLFAVSQR